MKDRIEIHHASGHVTSVPVDLSMFDHCHAFLRMGRIQEYLHDAIVAIRQQVKPGTIIYLIIQSKLNGKGQESY